MNTGSAGDHGDSANGDSVKMSPSTNDSNMESEDTYFPDLDEQSTSLSPRWSNSDVLPQTQTVVDMTAISTRPAKCPRLHWYCFKGDLLGILTCITEKDDLSETMTLINDKQQPILGVTPLYIAAQQGFLDICKLLVENGADVDAACFIEGSGETFTPAQIAQGYGHFRTWWYLKRQHSAGASGGFMASFMRRISCSVAQASREV